MLKLKVNVWNRDSQFKSRSQSMRGTGCNGVKVQGKRRLHANAFGNVEFKWPEVYDDLRLNKNQTNTKTQEPFIFNQNEVEHNLTLNHILYDKNTKF